jgi:hypothetical protein
MELASMGDLKHNLDRYGAFNEDQLYHKLSNLSFDRADLDVKPENLLVTQNGAV